MSAKDLIVVMGGCVIAVLLVVSMFARVAEKEKLLTNTIEATTKISDQTGWYGWYVIEKPVLIVPSILKYKIARGPKEPSIEAFAVSGTVVLSPENEFPQRILWVDIKFTGAIAIPMGMSTPVAFLKPMTK